MAQGLPVADVPKQRLVTTMRFDVVDVSCRDEQTVHLTETTGPVSCKICATCFEPSVVVTTLCACLRLLASRMAWARLVQRAPGLAAWNVCFGRHAPTITAGADMVTQAPIGW